MSSHEYPKSEDKFDPNDYTGSTRVFSNQGPDLGMVDTTVQFI